MAIQEGVRRIAVVIKVIGWIWLIGWLVGGAVSAFAAQPQDKWWESYPIVEQPKPGTPVPASDLPSVKWDAPAGPAPSKDLSSASNEELLAALEAKTKADRSAELRRKAGDFFFALIAVLGFAVFRTTAWVLDGFVDRRQT
ncbi:hypothetical protein D9M68_438850 [compost metagenome]|uniref:hypothetical protein n=1 Tax=Cupriavidus necator TaxID=106590 RepID=UPI0028B670D8